MKEITLNNEVFVLKTDIPQVKKEAKRFSPETITKLHKSLKGETFSCYNEVSEEYVLGLEEVTVIDGANIALINAKTEEAKRFLAYYINIDAEVKPLPKWDFIGKEGEINMSRFSIEYVNLLINFLKITDEAVSIFILPNHPIKLENKHFIAVLAPRIEQNE